MSHQQRSATIRMGAEVKGRLAGYDLSKGTIRFTEAKPIPEDVIWEILDLRLQQIG
jgi:uncharacterized protein YdhG (YjbR/CyaY superfamily)